MFPFPHLLGVAALEPSHIDEILQRADAFADWNAERASPPRSLVERTLINLFFEASTRTQASFELAAKRLGATVMNMSLKSSSMSKGETLLDTATTLNAMLPDILVVRHHDSGAVELLSQKVNCAVINAGDGRHEHPTQALLDALTMRRAFRARRGSGELRGLTIAICGDVLHSRVARSNIFLHQKLGNKVRVVGPPTLLPAGLSDLGVEVCDRLAEGVRDADVVMMLRLQRERMEGAFIPSSREYFHRYGLDAEELQAAKPDALVMHPGPMNRGVEIDSDLADDPERSVIAAQVEMGVAVRMAVLELVATNLPHTAPRRERPGAHKAQQSFYGVSAAARAPTRIAFSNARLLDPETGAETPGGLLVEGKTIRAMGPELFAPGALEQAPDDARKIDCAGAALAPGLIDMRVFIGEPGARHKESFGSGGEAAVAGGVTTIVTQPQTNPAVDDPALLDFIAQRVHEERIDHAMPRVRTMGALTKGLAGREMAEFGFMLEKGAVALTDGDSPVDDALVFRRCLDYAAALGALVCHHVQEPRLSAGACATEGSVATRRGLPSVPAAAELIMLERDLALAELTGARYHAALISTAAALDAVRRARARGVDVSCAVSPPHALLSDADVADYRTFVKVDPPLRSEADRAAIAAGLADGGVDILVSNHRPQSEQSKRLPFAQAAPGAVGLETLLSTALEVGAGGGRSLAEALRPVTIRPAERLGLSAGRLKPGAPADLIVFDPDRAWVVDRRALRSKSKNTPFDRRAMRGLVLRTIVNGRLVYEGEPAGLAVDAG